MKFEINGGGSAIENVKFLVRAFCVPSPVMAAPSPRAGVRIHGRTIASFTFTSVWNECSKAAPPTLLDLSSNDSDAEMPDVPRALQGAAARAHDAVHNRCIILCSSDAYWHAQCVHIAAALECARPFGRYAVCCDAHADAEQAFLLQHLRTAASVPSLIECLLPARVYLSAETFATPAVVAALQLHRIINITPQPPHADLAVSIVSLADMLDVQGDLEAARDLYARALAIRDKTLPPHHQNVRSSVQKLAAVCERLGDAERAAALRERLASMPTSSGAGKTSRA